MDAATNQFLGTASNLEGFDDGSAAFERVRELYECGTDAVRNRFKQFLAGEPVDGADPACYPFVGMIKTSLAGNERRDLSYGNLPSEGVFGTTLTRPDIFEGYYREQFELLQSNHDQPLWIGRYKQHGSDPRSTFVIESSKQRARLSRSPCSTPNAWISPWFVSPTTRQQRLRVRPETLCRITEFSEHESNGRELDEGERVAVEVLPVLGQSAAAVEPGDGAFDHPTPGLDDEALHPIGSLDDLGLEIGQDAGQGAVKDRPLIGAVGEQFPEKGKQTEQGRQQRETAVAILNVGGGDDAVQQQALRIDQNMPLLALDQLAGIETVAVDASPPFSALFTL